MKGEKRKRTQWRSVFIVRCGVAPDGSMEIGRRLRIPKKEAGPHQIQTMPKIFRSTPNTPRKDRVMEIMNIRMVKLR